MSVPLLPLVLITHVALAVTLFLPTLLLPFTLRARRSAVDSGSRVVQLLIGFEARGSLGVGVAVAATGFLLVLILGASLLSKPWLVTALTIYALNLLVAFFIQRPNLRPLLGITAGPDDRGWAARARRQRYVSYVMAAMIGTVGFLMSTKPQLW
jgi:hypothetical protein